MEGASSPAVADTPTISKITPTKIIKSSNTKPNVNGTNDNTLLLPKFKANDTKNVAMVNVNTFSTYFHELLGTSFCVCTEVNGSEVGKDCGLGPAGFPKGRPVRHRNWRFPLRPLRLSPSARLDYHLAHTVIPTPPSPGRNSLGVFLNINPDSLVSFAVKVSRVCPLPNKGASKAPWPGALCCKPLSPKHHSRQATLHPTLMYD